MMKKPLLAILAITMIFSITACGTNYSSNESAPVTNALATDNNKSSCDVLRANYSENGQVLTDWSNQTATDADLETALKKMGDEFTNFEPPYSSGDLGTTIQTMAYLFKRARVSISNGDSVAVVADFSLLPDLATKFDFDCKSIGR